MVTLGLCIEPEVRVDVGLLGSVPLEGGGGVDGRVVGRGIHFGRAGGEREVRKGEGGLARAELG